METLGQFYEDGGELEEAGMSCNNCYGLAQVRWIESGTDRRCLTGGH